MMNIFVDGAWRKACKECGELVENCNCEENKK